MRKFLRKVRGYAVTFFAGVLAILSILFLGRKSPHFEAEQTEHEKRLNEQQDQKAEDRANQNEDAQELRKKILTGTLCVLFVLGAALASGTRARAAATPAATPGRSTTVQSGPFVPADYETLKRYYLATWDLSEKWRQLYQEAEASVTELRESNARLLAMVESQRKELEQLRNRGPSFGLVGGATWSAGSGPGLFAGAGIAW